VKNPSVTALIHIKIRRDTLACADEAAVLSGAAAMDHASARPLI
jgi:hypothetical protein